MPPDLPSATRVSYFDRLRRIYRRLAALPVWGRFVALPLSLYRLPALADQVRRIEAQLDGERRARLALAERFHREAACAYPDDIYQFLEEQFRGSRDDLEKRLIHYLPLVQSLPAPPWPLPLVDLGCGRGEWIELLARHGIPARGVDCSPQMISVCQQRGLDVAAADALEFLKGLPDEQVPAVSAIQFIEHLQPPMVAELLQEVFRVLRPGGLVLLETPNPENVQVSAYYFRLDPTHRHPVPPPLTTHTMAAVGFIHIRVLRPEIFDPPIFEDPRLNRFFCASMDYAAYGYKPDAHPD